MNIPNDSNSVHRKLSPGYVLAITIVGIALAEVIAMIIIYSVRSLPYPLQVLLDASIMIVIIFPLLYVLTFKPLLLHIQRQERTEGITRARLRWMQYSNTHELEELICLFLDEMEELTGSTIGFFNFLEADQKTIQLQVWSTNTLTNMCSAKGKVLHSNVDEAGVWADAARLRQPVIHNNLAALPDRKGMPIGHALVIRELLIPIVRDSKVTAVLGMGNKPRDYSASDVELVSTLADFAWDIIKHKRAESAILLSEEKFRAIANWTYDWENWLDPDGNIIYISPSCERITGYTPEEFISDSGLLLRIAHPDDRQFYEEHQKITHDETAGPVIIEFRIISKDGKERWIEHICRPIFSPDNRHLGRRISNRDITARKQAQNKILEQNRREVELVQTIQTLQTDIARDLHDTLGQTISFLRMNLEHLSETDQFDTAVIKTQLQHMTTAANEAYDLIRTMLAVLQTRNLTDPQSLFARYAEQIAERSGIQFLLSSQGKPGQLSSHQIRQLFYIFRESTSNIEKYAMASQVTGEFVWGADLLTLVISDNGCGFDTQATQIRGHYGLRFMRERAENLRGTFEVKSTPGKGTTIVVSVPYGSNTTDHPEQATP